MKGFPPKNRLNTLKVGLATRLPLLGLSVDVTASPQACGLPNLLRRVTAAIYVSIVRDPRGCVNPVSQERPGQLPSLRSAVYSRTRSCSNPQDFRIRRPRSLVRVCGRLPRPDLIWCLSQRNPALRPRTVSRVSCLAELVDYFQQMVF